MYSSYDICKVHDMLCKLFKCNSLSLSQTRCVIAVYNGYFKFVCKAGESGFDPVQATCYYDASTLDRHERQGCSAVAEIAVKSLFKACKDYEIVCNGVFLKQGTSLEQFLVMGDLLDA